MATPHRRRRPPLAALAPALAAALLAVGGCTTYVIDSNPQGLRVSVNNVEEGFTPCRYFLWSQFYYPLEVTVAPPQPRQLEAYAAERNVSVQAITTPQTKVLTPRSPSGTVYFDFIATERDLPPKRTP